MLKLERESWMRRGQFRTIWREKGFKCSGGNPMYVGWRIYGVRNCCRRLANWWSKYFNSNLPRCCVGAETSPGWHHRHFTLLSELLLIISTQLFSVADVPSHNMRSSAPLCMQSGGPAGQPRDSRPGQVLALFILWESVGPLLHTLESWPGTGCVLLLTFWIRKNGNN